MDKETGNLVYSLLARAVLCIIGYIKDSCIVLGRNVILPLALFGN